MKIIVGLGNPGKKYERTRHNVGRAVVDALEGEARGWKLEVRKEVRNWRLEKKLLARVSGPYTLVASPYSLILAKPTVFMNESGRAVKRLLKHFKTLPANLWIIHDDIDLPLGRIKIQVGGGAAGHHGVESVIKEIGTEDFVRFRLGIGRPKLDKKLDVRSEIIENFVLSKFRQEEKPVVEEMMKRAVEAVKFGLREGIEKAVARVW